MKNECLKIVKLFNIRDKVKIRFLKSNITMIISNNIFNEKVKNGFWIL
jgi:hypothetical protein